MKAEYAYVKSEFELPRLSWLPLSRDQLRSSFGGRLC